MRGTVQPICVPFCVSSPVVIVPEQERTNLWTVPLCRPNVNRAPWADVYFCGLSSHLAGLFFGVISREWFLAHSAIFIRVSSIINVEITTKNWITYVVDSWSKWHFRCQQNSFSTQLNKRETVTWNSIIPIQCGLGLGSGSSILESCPTTWIWWAQPLLQADFNQRWVGFARQKSIKFVSWYSSNFPDKA